MFISLESLNVEFCSSILHLLPLKYPLFFPAWLIRIRSFGVRIRIFKVPGYGSTTQF